MNKAELKKTLNYFTSFNVFDNIFYSSFLVLYLSNSTKKINLEDHKKSDAGKWIIEALKPFIDGQKVFRQYEKHMNIREGYIKILEPNYVYFGQNQPIILSKEILDLIREYYPKDNLYFCERDDKIIDIFLDNQFTGLTTQIKR